jgi:hypothetical protein
MRRAKPMLRRTKRLQFRRERGDKLLKARIATERIPSRIDAQVTVRQITWHPHQRLQDGERLFLLARPGIRLTKAPPNISAEVASPATVIAGLLLTLILI